MRFAAQPRSRCNRILFRLLGPGAQQKFWKSYWCVPFTATFKPRRRIAASCGEGRDADEGMTAKLQRISHQECSRRAWAPTPLRRSWPALFVGGGHAGFALGVRPWACSFNGGAPAAWFLPLGTWHFGLLFGRRDFGFCALGNWQLACSQRSLSKRTCIPQPFSLTAIPRRMHRISSELRS